MKDIFRYFYDGKPIPYSVAKRLIKSVCGYIPFGITPWVHLVNCCDTGNERAKRLREHFISSGFSKSFHYDDHDEFQDSNETINNSKMFTNVEVDEDVPF